MYLVEHHAKGLSDDVLQQATSYYVYPLFFSSIGHAAPLLSIDKEC